MGKSLIIAIDAVRAAEQPGRLRAVAYLRVSTEEQAKGYGIAYTEKKVLRYFEKKSYEHVGTFADEGFSGSLEANDRPELKRLMELARQEPRPFDLVGVNEGRAIGRTGRAFWRWVWELEDLGIYVAVAKKDYDNSTPAGRSQMRKDADYAEEERELIRERTQGGIQEKAEDGLYPGGNVPFGWRIEDSRYALSPTESATLRRSREVFITKRSWTTVALTLNSESRLTRSGKPWTRENIRSRTLSEAVLNNHVVWRGDRAERRQDGSLVYGEQVIIDLPPIFTDEEIKELRDAAEAGERPASSSARTYILSGIMISPCGRPYTGHQHRPNEVVYRCKGREEAHPGAGDTCSCPYLEATSAEDQVWKEAAALLGDAERMKVMARDWLGATADQQVDHVRRIAELDQQIAEQQDVIDVTTAVTARQAAKRGLRGEEAEAAVERVLKPLTAELDGLHKLRLEAEGWQREASQAVRRLEQLERLAQAARSNLAALTPPERRELLQLAEAQAEVVRCAPRRKGVACKVTAWFTERNRDVPVLTDEGWERIKPAFAGRSDAAEPRPIVEAMLRKAATGERWQDMPEYGNPRSLQTRAYRWLTSGTWATAMDLLRDAQAVPAWAPDPVEIRVTLRPLAIESCVGDGESEGWMEGSRSVLELTFLTAA